MNQNRTFTFSCKRKRCTSPKEKTVKYFLHQIDDCQLPQIIKPKACKLEERKWNYQEVNEIIDNLNDDMCEELYKVLCAKIFKMTDIKCHKAAKLANKSIRGELLSPNRLRKISYNRKFLPKVSFDKPDINNVSDKMIRDKHDILMRRVENRQKIIRDMQIDTNSKNQILKIFKLGTNLYEMRHKRQK